MKRLALGLEKCFHSMSQLATQAGEEKKKYFAFRVEEYIKIYQMSVVKETVPHMPTNCPGKI